MAEIEVDLHGLSDPGNVRDNNEDHYLVAQLAQRLELLDSNLDVIPENLGCGCSGYLMMVADGVGGNPAGEVASGLAIETATEYISCSLPWFLTLAAKGEKASVKGLEEALEKSHAAIHLSGPHRSATTMTLAFFLWPTLYIAHAGDSRGYLLRRGQLQRLTYDHTVAGELERMGSPGSTVLQGTRVGGVVTKVLGGRNEEQVKPDVYDLTLEYRDIVLLCTDGLTKELEPTEIKNQLLKAHSAKEAAESLRDAALEAGGSDNITLIVLMLPFEDDEDTRDTNPKFIPSE